jgi:hypothetical protein
MAPLHLHDVGDRVGAPHVAGIDLDRGAAGRFGTSIVAALLEREGAAR